MKPIRNIAVAPLTTKGTSLVSINLESTQAEPKDLEVMPTNGSGDLLSTLSQSPPLILDGDERHNDNEVI